MKLTEKEFKVLEFLINSGRNYNTSVHGSLLTKVIFDEEIIKKYSHARTKKTVIETMVYSYLGRMCRKDLIWSEYKINKYSDGRSYSYYVGHYCTKKGKEAYDYYIQNKCQKKT
jgi:hypothetical protein